MVFIVLLNNRVIDKLAPGKEGQFKSSLDGIIMHLKEFPHCCTELSNPVYVCLDLRVNEC